MNFERKKVRGNESRQLRIIFFELAHCALEHNRAKCVSCVSLIYSYKLFKVYKASRVTVKHKMKGARDSRFSYEAINSRKLFRKSCSILRKLVNQVEVVQGTG